MTIYLSNIWLSFTKYLTIYLSNIWLSIYQISHYLSIKYLTIYFTNISLYIYQISDYLSIKYLTIYQSNIWLSIYQISYYLSIKYLTIYLPNIWLSIYLYIMQYSEHYAKQFRVKKSFLLRRKHFTISQPLVGSIMFFNAFIIACFLYQIFKNCISLVKNLLYRYERLKTFERKYRFKV